MAGKAKLTRTITELFSLYPDYAMMIISAEEGITEKTVEQYESMMVLDIPFFVVVNKMDKAAEDAKQSLFEKIRVFLEHNGGKKALVIDSKEQIAKLGQHLIETNVPIFFVFRPF
jgi:GTPase